MPIDKDYWRSELRRFPSDYIIVIPKYLLDDEFEAFRRGVEELIDSITLRNYTRDDVRIVRDEFNDETYINIYAALFEVERLAQMVSEIFGVKTRIESGPRYFYAVIRSREGGRALEDTLSIVSRYSDDYKVLMQALNPEGLLNKVIYRDDYIAILAITGSFSTAWDEQSISCDYINEDGESERPRAYLKNLKEVTVTLIHPRTNEQRTYP